jgi:hypothetical protein
MDMNIIIEVTIGILFVWVLLALITSQIQEWLASIFNWRADMLEDSIGVMLQNPELAKQFYDHPLIKSLYTSKGASLRWCCSTW